MNKTSFLFCLTLVALVRVASSQNLVLESGSTITYEFSGLSLQRGSAGGVFNIRTEGTTPFTPLLSMQVEMFENNTMESPLWMRTYSWTYGMDTLNFVDFGGDGTGAWEDRQGAVRISVLGGPVEFKSFAFQAFSPNGGGLEDNYVFVTDASNLNPGDGHLTVNRLVVVPEPDVWGLLAVGFAGLSVSLAIKRASIRRSKLPG